METIEIVESGLAALLFAAIFLWGGYFQPLRTLIKDRRSIISFGAGMSAAYVFVYVMPELHGARHAFTASVPTPTPYEGAAVYFVALVGFLVFYGLEHARVHLQEKAEEEKYGQDFKVHIGSFAAYVGLMSYLLVDNLEETPTSIALYAIAIGFHFLALDHSLRYEHGAAYKQVGRFVLSGMALLGWAAGLLFEPPHHVVALLLAFISGGIVINSMVMELPTEKDGRFLPFLIGGVLYGLVLLPLSG